MPNHKKPSPAVPQPVREKTADFVTRYANYSYLESTVWDLKIHFGQTDADRGSTVPINSQITLPWAQVKVMHYFLSLHLAGYEADNGRIRIPTGIIPQGPKGVPAAMKVFNDFVAANPEAAPKPETE